MTKDTDEIHASMVRLLEAARQSTAPEKIRILDYPDIGIHLEESTATISNWKRRGVSKKGALKAEERIGVSAHWVLNGKGQPTKRPADLPPEVRETPAAYDVKGSPNLSPAELLALLEVLLSDIPDALRMALGDVLAAWAREGGGADRRATLLALLASAKRLHAA